MNKPTSSYMFLPSVLQPKKELTLTDRFDEVVNAVCAVHGVKKEYLFRKYKKKSPDFISLPKHQAMYLIYELVRDEAGDRLNQATVAEYFNMERSAVTHAFRLIKTKIKPNRNGSIPDPDVKNQIEAITELYRKTASIEDVNVKLKQPERRALIKQVRIALGMPQKSFSGAVAIRYNTYVFLERGEMFITEAQIERVISYFNTRKEQILKGLEDVASKLNPEP